MFIYDKSQSVLSLLGGEPVSKKVFIGGLPTSASEDDVTAVFMQFGTVSIMLTETPSYSIELLVLFELVLPLSSLFGSWLIICYTHS